MEFPSMRYQKRLVIQNVPVKQELFGTLIVLWAPEQVVGGGRAGINRAAIERGCGMDGRYGDGPAVRREGGNLDVKKEQPDKEKAIAARARQRAIGRELRRMYDDVVQEPVPEDFLELLRKIDIAKGKRDQTT
jgi:hypothetical protein